MHQGGIENKETHRLGCLEGTGQWAYGGWAESINHPYNSFLTYVEIYEAKYLPMGLIGDFEGLYFQSHRIRRVVRRWSQALVGIPFSP
jgi:hypothetical protein